MPHQIVEYSANLDDALDLPGLVNCLHEAALATGVFPLAGLRTRCARRKSYRIADGHPDNAFVHVSMRIGYGRSLADRTRSADEISQALFKFLSPLSDSQPLAISFEMQEIDAHTNRKQNNLREHLARRDPSQAAGAQA